VLLPPAMPSTAQVAAPPPGTVAVNCCVWNRVMAAVLGDSVTAPLEIVTVAVATLLVPPAPLQVKEYDVVAERAPVPWLPLVPSAPLQPPEAVHDVALIELHVSVETPPEATTEGFATIVAVGITLTSTVAAPLVPPVPVHVKEYELRSASAPVLCVPLVAFVPLQLPDAVHDVAFVELHVSVEALPLATEVGAAPSDAVGSAVVVLVLALLPPPQAAISSDAPTGTKSMSSL
jgi:hypothetical protein